VEPDLQKRLGELRNRIDQFDHQILQILNERMRLVQQIGRIKFEAGLPLFDPGREEAIYTRLCRENEGPLSDFSLRSIYREIMAASRVLQHPLEVAFLGPEWTYSHLAALSLFGHSTHYVPLRSLEEVFDNLVKGEVHVGIIPIENSLEGGMARSMDLLYEQEVQVVRECYLEIAYYLAGKPESLADVKRVYAHPQSLAQCRRWLLEKLPAIATQECSSTAQAALLARDDRSGAAICNLFAAHHYQLNIMATRIEDQPLNITRFFALAQRFNPPTGMDKTSILFAVPDQPGALNAALEAFTQYQLNMTRIESRPSRTLPWHYLFYADIEGHRDEAAVRDALHAMEARVTFLKVLGSYPRSDPLRPIRFKMEEVAPANTRANG
jgi:chorismate mutase/prephenate dehydratase